ncbi:hypothetical protein LguiA_028807 [Lonicera macranthoides]
MLPGGSSIRLDVNFHRDALMIILLKHIYIVLLVSTHMNTSQILQSHICYFSYISKLRVLF